MECRIDWAERKGARSERGRGDDENDVNYMQRQIKL